MASRLEKHEKFILDQLLLRHTYESIARSLNELGCRSSRQNLMSWVKNRTKKLKVRRELIDPPTSTAPSDQHPTRQVAAAPNSKIALVASSAKSSTFSQYVTKDDEENYLNEVIKFEEKKINSNLLDRNK